MAEGFNRFRYFPKQAWRVSLDNLRQRGRGVHLAERGVKEPPQNKFYFSLAAIE